MERLALAAAALLLFAAACAHAPSQPAAASPPDLTCGALTGEAASRLAGGLTLYEPDSGLGFGKEQLPLAAMLPAIAAEQRVLAARALFPPGEAPQLALVLAPKDAQFTAGQAIPGGAKLGLAGCSRGNYALLAPPVELCGEGQVAQLMRSEAVALPGGAGASSLLSLCANPSTMELQENALLVGRGSKAVPATDPKDGPAGILGQAGIIGQQFVIDGGGYARKDPLTASGWFPLGGRELVHVAFTKERSGTEGGVDVRGVAPARPPPTARAWDPPVPELWLFFGKGGTPAGCTGNHDLRCARLDGDEDKQLLALPYGWVAGAWLTAEAGAAALGGLGVDPASGDWFHSGGDETAQAPGGRQAITSLRPVGR